MKRILIASAGIATLMVAAPAFAASAPAAPNWTGFYAGVNAGYGGDKFDYPASASYQDVLSEADDSDSPLALSGVARQTSSGFLGGGQVGYNYETADGWVFGAEADIDGTAIKGETALAGSLSGIVDGSASASIKSNLDYLGTARIRVGHAIADGRFVPYATGGLAYGQVKTSAGVDVRSSSEDLFNYSVSRTSTRTGWTAGVGADYAITDRISFRAEYLYVDLGTATLLNNSFDFGDGSIAARIGLKTTANIVRVGVNYRFGG